MQLLLFFCCLFLLDLFVAANDVTLFLLAIFGGAVFSHCWCFVSCYLVNTAIVVVTAGVFVSFLAVIVVGSYIVPATAIYLTVNAHCPHVSTNKGKRLQWLIYFFHSRCIILSQMDGLGRFAAE
jgi:hypothetical protein